MKRRYILLLDGALLAAIPLGSAASKWMLDALPDCIFLQHGLLCPACGGTRCLRALTRGDFLLAFRMNPYLFCTAFLALALVVLLNVTVLSGGRWGSGLLRKAAKPWLLILWAAGFVVFGILRNFL